MDLDRKLHAPEIATRNSAAVTQKSSKETGLPQRARLLIVDDEANTLAFSVASVSSRRPQKQS